MQGHQFADRYRLDDLLGRGGMAEVWRGRDLRLERPVAIKILDQVALADPSTLERFRREAVAVARMAHPNIVAGYDFGAEDDRPYLVMELVEGTTLDTMLQRGRLPVSEAVSIAAQACAALDAAHRADVVHRDIKPGNLIVTADGTVKVLDFGIARLQDAANQAALTRVATVVGTSQYMAPEQASGGAVDAGADLYALGCVLYAMLTGEPPFHGDNPMAVLYQHMHHTPVPAREHRPEIPAALDALVTTLLAKDPQQRPASAQAVRSALISETDLATQAGSWTQDGAAGQSRQSGGTSVMPIGRAAVPPPGEPTSSSGFFPLPQEPRPSRFSSRGAVLGVSVAAAVAVLLLLVALISGGDERANPEPPSQTAAPSSESPSPSPSRTPTDPGPTATDAAGRLAELRALVNQQVEAGEIEIDAARKLDEEINKIADDIRKGNPEEAAKRAAELVDVIDDLEDDDELTTDAEERLVASLDRLARVLPPPDTGNEENGDNDRGKGKGRDKDKDKGHDDDD